MTENEREEILLKAKQILFTTEMIRAILDGRKTQTRRVALPNEDLHEFKSDKYPDGWWLKGRVYKNWDDLMYDMKRGKSCKYQIDDILYVRETWRIWKAHRYDADAHIEFKAGGQGTVLCFSHGCTDSVDREDYDGFIGKWGVGAKWHPSIHMPKEAARIFLRVTNVRVERLQDITDEESEKEGCSDYASTANGFCYVWDSTVKKSDLDKYGWDANPWVWVIEFERID